MTHKITKIESGLYEYRGIRLQRRDQAKNSGTHWRTRSRIVHANGAELYLNGKTRAALVAEIDKVIAEREAAPAETVVADFPAFEVVERAPVDGAVEISTQDILTIARKTLRGATIYSGYKAGSVASCAAQYGNDVEAALARAKARGEKLHWINAQASSLTSHARAKGRRILLKLGMVVRFEGQTFTIASAPNDNLRLIAQ